MKLVCLGTLVLIVMAAAQSDENVANADLGLDYDTDTFDDREFEYFYNMELLEKIEELSVNETEIDDHVLAQLIDEELEYEETTELDIILDTLLEEGDLIAEVLDEIESEMIKTPSNLHEVSVAESWNQITFYGFLIGFIIMFIISMTLTFIYYKKNINTRNRNTENPC